MTTREQVEVTFEAPAPGQWDLEATHHGRRPMSHFFREIYVREGMAGFAVLVERYGLPLSGIRMELVNGCTYMRPVGLGEGSKPKPPPPDLIMKLIVRLHPEMRRRNRTAEQAWAEKRWRLDVDRWFDHDRAIVVDANLEFQNVDLQSLDDKELSDQVAVLLKHFATQARLNLENHGGDIMPTGDFLAHCQAWGIDTAEAAALLKGSSPATIETAELLAPAARAIASSEVAPTSVDDVRNLGAEAADAVDSWLELHGWRLVTSDDIDKPTLAERPVLQLAALLAATDALEAVNESADPAEIRTKIPAAERLLFDDLLAEARYGMRQRDDVVGIRWNWSGGLLRRALLEAGKRMVGEGRLENCEHVVELSPGELGPLLISGSGPTAEEVSSRAEQRDHVEASNPPDMLGDPEPPPPIAALPKPMARATAAMLTLLEAEGLSAEGSSEQLAGTGIGAEIYRGPARVATDANEVLDRLEPGDVLIAPFTGPSYNSILPILGGLVVEAGGPMCHAAIVAREFGLPAVIGASGAMSKIPDGAIVEVDPIKGLVRIVS